MQASAFICTDCTTYVNQSQAAKSFSSTNRAALPINQLHIINHNTLLALQMVDKFDSKYKSSGMDSIM